MGSSSGTRKIRCQMFVCYSMFMCLTAYSGRKCHAPIYLSSLSVRYAQRSTTAVFSLASSSTAPCRFPSRALRNTHTRSSRSFISSSASIIDHPFARLPLLFRLDGPRIRVLVIAARPGIAAVESIETRTAPVSKDPKLPRIPCPLGVRTRGRGLCSVSAQPPPLHHCPLPDW